LVDATKEGIKTFLTSIFVAVVVVVVVVAVMMANEK